MTCKYYWIPIGLFVIAFNFHLKSNSQFGVDVERYSAIFEYGVSEWTPYYLKEFVSWGAFDLLAQFAGESSLSEKLLIIDCAMLVVLWIACRKSKNAAWYRIFLFYPSFAFTLLSFNVLRQYVSIFFLMGACIASVERRVAGVVVFSVMAIAAHNGAVLAVLPLVLFQFKDARPILKMLAFLVGLGVLVSVFASDLLIRLMSSGESTLEEPGWKVALYAVLSFYLVAILAKKHDWLNRYQNELDHSVVLLAWYFFLGGGLLSLLPMENWMISRNWLTIISIQSFMILCIGRGIQQEFFSRVIPIVAFAVPMWALTFLHPGAREMAFGGWIGK